MKKLVMAVVAVGVLVAGGMYFYGGSGQVTDGGPNGAPGGQGGAAGRGGRAGGRGGFPGGQFGRPPMTVEVAKSHRASVAAEVTVVGNLIGDATVSVAPRTAGRIQDISVRLGDRVSRGQRLASIEDFEIQEQVKQAEAAQEVAQATIRQRDADLQLALTSVERSRNLYQRDLLPKQTLDDNEARYLSAVASLDLAKAQSSQSRARLDELRINLANTIITSPVNGFVSRRSVDPGAFVSQNAPIVDVVDISTVRLVANVVEKDLKDLRAGAKTRVEVDAYPGEQFTGRIARVSPVLDPATRTAPIEIEIPNGDFRLKPGMYARVNITTSTRKDALVVPANAVVDLGGRRGVFTPVNESAIFRSLQIGTEQSDFIEVIGGLQDGETVITTGAGALRDGDRIVLAGAPTGRSGGGRGRADRGDEAGAAGPGNGSQDGGEEDGPSGRASAAPAGSGPATGGSGAREGREGGLGRRGGRGGENGASMPTAPPSYSR